MVLTEGLSHLAESYSDVFTWVAVQHSRNYLLHLCP